MHGFSLRRPAWLIWVVLGTAVLGFVASPRHASAQVSAVESAPSPTTLGPVSAPTSSPEPMKHHRRHHDNSAAGGNATPAPIPSVTPSPVSFTTFDGTWEVQLQPGSRTVYDYLYFVSGDGTNLNGRLQEEKTETPVTGQLDGDRFRISGADAKGPFVMTGYEENSATMVGLMLQGNSRIAFTATHQTVPNARKAKAGAKHHKHGSQNGSNG